MRVKSTLTETIDEGVIEAAPRLRVIANCAAGFNNIAVEQAKMRGVVVTNTPDVLTETTADLTWALVLATARRLAEGYTLVRSGAWTGWDPCQLLGHEVHGAILGLVGMGRIGRAVARRAQGFDMAVLYHSRRPLPVSQAEPWSSAGLDELLARSDFISLHVPFTADTHHLIDERALRKMKPSAILINTSRGPVVDEGALVEAIRGGRLAGAGLDVYEREPEVHPGLQELPQVVTLPHVGSATLATRVRMGMMCLENVMAVLAMGAVPRL